MRARLRVHSPKKNAWCKGHFEQMKTTDMVFSHHHAIFSSVAIAVPKESGFRMAVYNGAVNQLVKQEAMPTSRREKLGFGIRECSQVTGMSDLQVLLHHLAHKIAVGVRNKISCPCSAPRRGCHHTVVAKRVSWVLNALLIPMGVSKRGRNGPTPPSDQLLRREKDPYMRTRENVRDLGASHKVMKYHFNCCPQPKERPR